MLKYEQDKGIKPTYQSVIHVPNPENVNTKCYLNILLCILCQHLIFFIKLQYHIDPEVYLFQYDSLQNHIDPGDSICTSMILCRTTQTLDSLAVLVCFFVEPHRPWILQLYQYDSLQNHIDTGISSCTSMILCRTIYTLDSLAVLVYFFIEPHRPWFLQLYYYDSLQNNIDPGVSICSSMILCRTKQTLESLFVPV